MNQFTLLWVCTCHLALYTITSLDFNYVMPYFTLIAMLVSYTEPDYSTSDQIYSNILLCEKKATSKSFFEVLSSSIYVNHG